MKLKKIGLCMLSVLTAATMSYSGTAKSSAAAPNVMNIPTSKTIVEYYRDAGMDVILPKKESEGTGHLEDLNKSDKLIIKSGLINDLEDNPSTATAMYVKASDMKNAGSDTKSYNVSGNFAKYTISNAFKYVKSNNTQGFLDIVYTFSNLNSWMYGNTENKVDHAGLVAVYAPDSDDTHRTVCASAATLLTNNRFVGGRAYATMNITVSFVDSTTKKTVTSVAPAFTWNFGDIDIGDKTNGNGTNYYSGDGYPNKAEKVMFSNSYFESTGKSHGSQSWLKRTTDYPSPNSEYTTYYNTKHATQSTSDGEYVQAAGTIAGGKGKAKVRWEGSGCGTSVSGVMKLKITGTIEKDVYDPQTSSYNSDKTGWYNKSGNTATFRVRFQYHRHTDIVSPNSFQIEDHYDSHYFFAPPKWDKTKSSSWATKFKMSTPKAGTVFWTLNNNSNVPDDTWITFVYTLKTKKGSEADYSGAEQVQPRRGRAPVKSYAKLQNKARLILNGDVDDSGYKSAYAYVPLDALTLSKTVNKSLVTNAKVDDTVTFTYTIKNNGNSTLHHVNIATDSQDSPSGIKKFGPNDLTITSFSSGVSGITRDSKNVAHEDAKTGGATMKKGSTITMKYTYKFDQAFINHYQHGAPFTNTATVVGRNAQTEFYLTSTDNATVKITKPVNPAVIQITKKDAVTGQIVALTSAKFKIYEDTNGNGEYDSGDSSKGSYVTNRSGLVASMNDDVTSEDDALGVATSAAKFKYGKYFIREMVAPWRYALNENVAVVDITKEQCESANPYVARVEISNSRIYGTVTVSKYSTNTDYDSYLIDDLSGNTFVIKAAEDIVRTDIVSGTKGNYQKVVEYHNGDVIGTATTDSDGNCTFTNVPLGYLTIEETATSPGFVSGQCTFSCDDDRNVMVGPNTFVIDNDNDSTEVDINAHLNAGNPPTQTRIRKIDAITRQPLEGALFTVKEGDRTVCQFESIGDGDGWYTIGGLVVGHTYTVHEERSPDYYVATTKDTSFTVENNTNWKEIVVENEPEKCVITVKKRIKAADVWISHGDPSFIIKINGSDFYGKDVSYEVPFTFTENEIRNAVNNGTEYLEKSQRVEVRHGTYTTSEMNVSRYAFENIYGLYNASDNGNATAYIDLMSDRYRTEATVGYQNKYTRYDKWSHKHITVNDFTSNYTNNGPYGRPWGGSHGTGTLS